MKSQDLELGTELYLSHLEVLRLHCLTIFIQNLNILHPSIQLRIKDCTLYPAHESMSYLLITNCKVGGELRSPGLSESKVYTKTRFLCHWMRPFAVSSLSMNMTKASLATKMTKPSFSTKTTSPRYYPDVALNSRSGLGRDGGPVFS
jgi:hypothetical protein